VNDLFGPVAPWMGILGAAGVVLVLLAWNLLRGAGPLARGIAACLGAVFLVGELSSAISRSASIASILGTYGLEHRTGRRLLDLALVMAGIGVGIVAVLWAHARTAEAAEDLADEAVIQAGFDAEEPDTLEDAESDDAYVRRRERLVAVEPWVDLAAIAVAMSLPVVGAGFAFAGYGGSPFDRANDVSVWIVSYHVIAGLMLALPLLVALTRDEVEAHPVVPLLFGLLAVRAVVVPAWPQVFANELWAAFAVGLAAGLVAPVLLGLLARVARLDRMVVATGVCVAIGIAMVNSAVTSKMLVEESEDFRPPAVFEES
jgi:hypothetical protein